MKNLIPLFLITAAGANAATADDCAPTPPATCYELDKMECSYCLGPAQRIVNAPVRPYTCNGDWEITVAGFYWTPQMDGLEFAVLDQVARPEVGQTPDDLSTNVLIDAQYLTPNFHWDFGFKLGLGYNSTCDSWDFGVLWTSFDGNGSREAEASEGENISLIPLWLAYTNPEIANAVSNIQANWDVDFDLIDLELGREYWVSPRLSLRHYLGVRIAVIGQDYTILQRGGALNVDGVVPFINEVDLDVDFKGVGLRSGLFSAWNFGCGWAIFGNVAPSIVYGRFKFDHTETNRESATPFTKTQILSTDDSFRSSRAMLDLELGVRWFGLLCDCKYGLGVSLAWEQHLFYHFNQFWRVERIAPDFAQPPVNLTGENGYHQRSGTLSTQGWTLSVQFDF